MAGHEQLKFVMMECSKTQIRLMRPSYWLKYEHLVLVNRLGSLPRNSVDRLTDRLDMTLIVLNGL